MKYLILNEDLYQQDPLKQLNDQSINLIITSPPYFNARNYKLHIKTDGNAPYRINLTKESVDKRDSYENYLNNMENVIVVLERLLRKGGFIIYIIGDIIFNKNHLSIPFHLFNILSKYFNWKETIIWDKTNVINFKSHSSRRAEKYLNQPIPFNYSPNFSHEYILIFTKSGNNISDFIEENTFNRKEFLYNYSRTIWKIETVPPSLLKEHPARFPFEIPNNLIKFYSNKEDIVFDPFGGFGTTLIEALRLGRIGVANDKEKNFCDLMENNIKILKKNPNFFINKLNLHRIKAHINNLKRKNFNNEKISNFLINQNFNRKLIEIAFRN